MSIKHIRKAFTALPLLAIVFSASMPAFAADPTIYRCGPSGSQRFSQIPCEENSEQVIVEDRHMFREAGAEESDSADSKAASNAQAFITQLEKQRNEQIAEIDRNIEELQSRAENPDETAEQSGDAEDTVTSLSGLQNTRQSIMSEYDAMISAARQRMETP